MKIQVLVHGLDHGPLMRIEIDDQQTVEYLRKIVENKVDTPPSRWDLTSGAHRMTPNAPLCEYGIEEQSTIWMQQRKIKQPVGDKPLTLIIKQVGTERTTQTNFSTEYTLGRCKHEIEATLTHPAGKCYLARHGELENLDDDKALGYYGIKDWDTVDLSYGSKSGRVTRARYRVVAGVKNYAHSWKLRHMDGNH